MESIRSKGLFEPLHVFICFLFDDKAVFYYREFFFDKMFPGIYLLIFLCLYPIDSKLRNENKVVIIVGIFIRIKLNRAAFFTKAIQKIKECVEC